MPTLPWPQRPWREWYQCEAWRRRARAQLRQQPLCERCLAFGKVTPAAIADHIQSHRQDWNTFLLAPLQSLCRSCHSGPKQQADRIGFENTIGPDGYPTDPRHPINRT